MKESKFYRIIRPLITAFVKIFLTPKYEGIENIKTQGPIILAGTHTSILDCILLISSTKRSIHFLAKKELWQGPKKIIFSNLGLIPVDRKNKDKNALITAKNYLISNKVIGIFPEGTTEKEKEKLLPFKIGAVKMAYDTKTEIVPFAITGDYKIFSKTLKIRFEKPIKITNDDLLKENTNLKNIISTMIKEK